MVDLPKNKRRRKPTDRAREARRLAERLEATTAARHDVWAAGGEPLRAEALTCDLDDLHVEKRVMRRDIYREAPVLEGRPVYRGIPGGGGAQ